MSRHAIGMEVTEVFAENGARDEIDGVFTDGFDANYATPGSAKKPQREYFNDLFAKTTAVALDVNRYGGALPWDAGLAAVYKKNAIVTSLVDNGLYKALQDAPGDEPSVSEDWGKVGVTLAEMDLALANKPDKSEAQYNATADTETRTLDMTSEDTTIQNIGDVLATLIADLKLSGVLQ